MSWPKDLVKTSQLPFPELRQLRERAGLTQLQLALKMGLNRSSIARIEQGKLMVDHYRKAKLQMLCEKAIESKEGTK